MIMKNRCLLYYDKVRYSAIFIGGKMEINNPFSTRDSPYII